ncbi:MAG: ABC transporter substrate-binding protein, partial [Desulfobacteraceae bacterium]
LYTLEETRTADPDLARAFSRASLEGWLYAFAHPDEALDITLKYIDQAKIPANRVHQKWMLARMQDLIRPPDKKTPFGRLDRADYELVTRELLTAGLIPSIPDYNSFFVE